jgi:hypothetical protein
MFKDDHRVVTVNGQKLTETIRILKIILLFSIDWLNIEFGKD